jgi:PEP-CTERM motif
MKTRRVVTSALAVTALVLAGLGTAQATLISGSLWAVSEATSQNAIPGNVPGTTPDITFDVSAPLNFSATGATVGTWLSSGGAVNVVENTSGALARLMDTGTQGTLVQFLGQVTVTNGQTFTVTHDDGLTLIIGGIDLGFNPGPTAPVTTLATYTGPSGNFPFQLVYGECCGGPAVLQVDLPFQPPAAPEPGTLAILGSGLLLGVMRRRRR